MLSNPNTAGTAKLLINTMIQMKGHDEAMEYFKALDQNINQYTKSGLKVLLINLLHQAR